jgi:hypothetical protein
MVLPKATDRATGINNLISRDSSHRATTISNREGEIGTTKSRTIAAIRGEIKATETITSLSSPETTTPITTEVEIEDTSKIIEDTTITKISSMIVTLSNSREEAIRDSRVEGHTSSNREINTIPDPITSGNKVKVNPLPHSRPNILLTWTTNTLLHTDSSIHLISKDRVMI